MKMLPLALLLATVAMAPAEAAMFHFDVAGQNLSGTDVHYSFDLDINPTPAFFDEDPDYSFFEIDGVSITNYAANGSIASVTTDDLQFFIDVTGGAFGNTSFTNYYFGYQLFSGPVSAPAFELGSYDLYISGDVPVAQLTITAASEGAVPEPTSWAMMLVGFGAIGSTIRRRQAVRFA